MAERNRFRVKKSTDFIYKANIYSTHKSHLRRSVKKDMFVRDLVERAVIPGRWLWFLLPSKSKSEINIFTATVASENHLKGVTKHFQGKLFNAKLAAKNSFP